MCEILEVSRSGYYDWVKRLDVPDKDHCLTKGYGIIPSMSRRGNCLDNACAESFFGQLKSECINRVKPGTFEEAQQLIDDYIYFYNYERIQLKSKLTPYEKRCQSA